MAANTGMLIHQSKVCLHTNGIRHLLYTQCISPDSFCWAFMLKASPSCGTSFDGISGGGQKGDELGAGLGRGSLRELDRLFARMLFVTNLGHIWHYLIKLGLLARPWNKFRDAPLSYSSRSCFVRWFIGAWFEFRWDTCGRKGGKFWKLVL